MREIKLRVYWEHQESDCFGFDYFDAYDGWKDKDSLQEPIALEQFTGLRDKNGKEIYEGDILRNESNYAPYNCVMEWHDDLGSCGCCYEHCESVGFVGRVLSGSEYVYSSLAAGYKDMEVIGNIHENMDLLK